MRNLGKKLMVFSLVIVLVLSNLVPVFADQEEEHYYDFEIDEDGTWVGMHIIPGGYVTVRPTLEESKEYSHEEKYGKMPNKYGAIVYGTGYEILPPVIKYRAGGYTVGEVEYAENGAVGFVRVDYVKLKKDRLEAIIKFKPVNSGKDDESGYFYLDNKGGIFDIGIDKCIEMTDHSNCERSYMFDNKKTKLNQLCDYELFFDGIGNILNQDKTRFKTYKRSWYNLEQKDSLFSDVPNNHWAMRSINKCKEMGLISGIGNNMYAPDGTLKVCEVVQVAYNDYCKDNVVDKNPHYKFAVKSVKEGDWYYNAMMWAYQNGIITDNIGPNDFASRELASEVFFKLSKINNIGLPNWRGFELKDAFPDMQNRPLESKKAVLALQNAEIISGYPNGTFGPDDKLTRAQMAVILDNFVYAKSKVKSGMYLPEEY